MRIFLIRHGESVANKEKIFQGWTDVSLSVRGHQQAKNLGNYFLRNKIRFDKIYSSPLKRAVETGQYLLQCSDFPDLITLNGLRSINVGQWAGFTIAEIKQRFPEEYKTWKSEPKVFCFPKGESIIDVQERAKASLFNILKEYTELEKNIVIVTHMITIKVLILELLNIDLNSIWEAQYTVPNTGMSVFEVKRSSDKDIMTFEQIVRETSTPHLD